MCRTKPAVLSGGCQALWRRPGLRIRSWRSIKLRLKLCERRRCKWLPEPIPESTAGQRSILRQAVEITIVVERRSLLHELEDAEHALAAFAVLFAELNRSTGPRIQLHHHALSHQTGFVHR